VDQERVETYSRARKDDGGLQPRADMDGDRELSTRRGPGRMHAALEGAQELARPTVRPRGQPPLGALVYDARVRGDGPQPLLILSFETGRSEAAEPAARNTGEPEPLEKVDVDVEGRAFGPIPVPHAPPSSYGTPGSRSEARATRPRSHKLHDVGRGMVLLAKDIMDASILTVDEEIDALACARAMASARKGYAIVTRGSGKTIAGIVTEWDFLEKVVAAGAEPSRLRVKQLATAEPQSCSPETPTDEVVTTMAKLGIRRIVVRSGDRVVGIITTKNILATFRQYIDKLSSEIAGYQSTSTPLG